MPITNMGAISRSGRDDKLINDLFSSILQVSPVLRNSEDTIGPSAPASPYLVLVEHTPER